MAEEQDELTLEERVGRLERAYVDPLTAAALAPGIRRDGQIVTVSPRGMGLLSQEDTTAKTRVDGSPIVDVERYPSGIPVQRGRVRIRIIRERG